MLNNESLLVKDIMFISSVEKKEFFIQIMKIYWVSLSVYLPPPPNSRSDLFTSYCKYTWWFVYQVIYNLRKMSLKSKLWFRDICR